MGTATGTQGCKSIFDVKENEKMPRENRTAAQMEETEKAADIVAEMKKMQKTVNADDTEGRFIYIGPTTNTGLVENTIFTGSREKIEEYLKPTIEKLPQTRMLIVATESLAVSRQKVKMEGTLLNKYYNDVLSLMRKNKGGLGE